MRRKSASVCLAAGWLIGGATGVVHAADTTWSGGAGNNLWNDPINWSAGVPTINDHATVFLNSGTVTLDLSGAPAIAHSVSFVAPRVNLINGVLKTDVVIGPEFGPCTFNSAATIAAATPGISITSDSYGATSNAGIRMRGGFGDGNGGGDFGLIGGGRLYNENTYTGPTDAFDLTLNENGTIRNSSVYRVSLMLVNNSAIANNDRLNDAAELQIRRGLFSIGGNGLTPISERVGTLRIDHGASDLFVGSAIQPVELVAASLARQPGGILRLLPNDPDQHLRLVQAPVLSGGQIGAGPTKLPVIRGVLARSGTVPLDQEMRFTTYDPVVGVRALRNHELAESIIPGNSFTNVRASTPQVVNFDSTINTLRLLDNGTMNVNNATLTLQTGLQFEAATGTPADTRINWITGSGMIRFEGEGIIYANGALQFPGNTHVIAVPIRADSLTVASESYEVVELWRANDIPGGITIGSGILASAAPGALGTGTIQIAESTLRFSAQSQTINNTILFDGVSEQEGAEEANGAFSRGGGFIAVDAGVTATLIGNLIGGGWNITTYGAGRLRIDGNASLDTRFFDGDDLEINGTFSLTRADSAMTANKLSGVGVIHTSIVGPTNLKPGHTGGDDAGRLTVDAFDNTNQSFASSMEFDLFGLNAGSQYDQLVVIKNAILNQGTSKTDLIIDLGFAPSLGTQFTILDDQFAGAITGTFNGLPQDAVFFADGRAFQISYLGGDGNDVVLTAVVPESSSLIFVFAPLAAIAFSGSRRRRVFFVR